MNPLLRLIDCGQSYWLDNLTRGKIKSDELKERTSKYGLRGVTSNPSIFNDAISESDDYDDQIKELVSKNKSIGEIYEALVVKDVQDACDILRTVYDESDGQDGFVSLEVSPYLAHDTEGTMDEVRRLSNAVDRPNLLIKIPGTSAGVPAIEEMLYEGLNINITLLFSIESYEEVARAYIRALERRVDEGKSVDNIASVASFFLSRIDVLVDQLLGHQIVPEQREQYGPRPEQLLGKVAIANAKLAYQRFKQLFSSERWNALKEKGACVQRVLWASTSTKNPLYSDVRYIEPLIGSHTVNTLPDSTIDAFADHGVIKENSVEDNLDEARRVFSDIEKVGIELDFVTQQLVNEGVQKFIDPFDKLMETIADKRQSLLADNLDQQSIEFGSLKSKMSSAFDGLDERQFTRRLFASEPYLWKSERRQIEVIENRLGWLNSVEDFMDKTDEILEFAEEIKNSQFNHVVLLGMGGSSLCPEVCREVFGSAPGYPQLIVLDNTAPAAIEEVESKIDYDKTLFIVASKSGTTVETLSFYRYFYQKTKQNVEEAVGKHFIAITDADTSLVKEANQKSFRRTFKNPEDIGGRYSVFSYFGLVPMALIGIDIKMLLNSTNQFRLSCHPFIPSKANPAVSLGTFLGMNHKIGRNKVTFVLSDSVRAFGYWVEQLLAESTGKEEKGLLPVESEPLGSTDVYQNDRVFVYMYTTDMKDRDIEEKLEALEEAGHPLIRIEMKDKINIGQEFYRWELATATAGAVIGINPFDEPNVSESKKNTEELLDEWKQKRKFKEEEPVIQEKELAIYCDESQEWFAEVKQNSVDDFINSFVDLAKSPDYLALLPYFWRTSERHELLQTLRESLRNHLKVATTLGYGPRYLHSTGQLHKGGPRTGVYILFTADEKDKISIPEEDYDLATLQHAQALGDYRSLQNKERRVVRVHLGKNIEEGLNRIISVFDSKADR